jgi:hypothetical protein
VAFTTAAGLIATLTRARQENRLDEKLNNWPAQAADPRRIGSRDPCGPQRGATLRALQKTTESSLFHPSSGCRQNLHSTTVFSHLPLP